MYSMGIELLPQSIRDKYETREWKHASAILHDDFSGAWKDITDLLAQFRLCESWITVGGGRKSKVADAIDGFLYARGWVENG